MQRKKIQFYTGHNSEEVNRYYLSLTHGCKGIIKDFEFLFNSDHHNSDYIVVFDSILSPIITTVPRHKIIFVAGEPSSIKRYDQTFLNQFGHVLTCQKNIQHKSKFLISPGHSWFSKKSYDEIKNIKKINKTKLLSIVASNKTFTKGHRDRFNFCMKLKEHMGDKVDIFGRGFNDFEDKWSVIEPYKYSISIENCKEPHWITEKLGDCFTSHTFPFYMGAQNVGNYYDKRSFKEIDIYNFEESLSIIKDTINTSGHYEGSLKYLIDSKNKYLDEHCILPMVCNFIERHLDQLPKENNTESICVYPEKTSFINRVKFSKSFSRIRNLIKR